VVIHFIVNHACSDMWIYEISYGPRRFYPNSYYTENPGTIFWERGNQWSRIYPSSDISPSPRVHHLILIFNILFIWWNDF